MANIEPHRSTSATEVAVKAKLNVLKKALENATTLSQEAPSAPLHLVTYHAYLCAGNNFLASIQTGAGGGELMDDTPWCTVM